LVRLGFVSVELTVFTAAWNGACAPGGSCVPDTFTPSFSRFA
jgi:hypothetical protein